MLLLCSEVLVMLLRFCKRPSHTEKVLGQVTHRIEVRIQLTWLRAKLIQLFSPPPLNICTIIIIGRGR